MMLSDQVQAVNEMVFACFLDPFTGLFKTSLELNLE